MKKVILGLAILGVIGLVGFTSYKVGYRDNNTITVSQQTDLMTESWQEVVIINNVNGRILYSGAVDELDDNLLNMQVVEVANCEDSFAITLFVE